ncbi:MAG: hypothetical protein JXL84_25740, partial [Deltaproteobacteria bacterium]|nr:hypothetical protein [Deltaproteobacteria bacterium]
MLHKYMQWSLRMRVLVPTVAVLCIAVTGLVFAVVKTQESLFSHAVLSAERTLETSTTEINKEFMKVSSGIDEQLKRMAKTSGELLSSATVKALEKERAVSIQESQKSLRDTAESMAVLLAQVAPGAILSKDFSSLLSYSKAAVRCPGVVYALFLNTEGRPLTQYLKADDPIVKKFLETGQGESRVAKVIDASRKDGSVYAVQKAIEVDGQNLGKVLLCMDMSPAEKMAEEMAGRFSSLIEENKTTVHAVLEKEGAEVGQKFAELLRSLGVKSKTSGDAVKQVISALVREVSESTEKVIGLLGGGSVVVVLLILFYVVSRATKAILRLSSILHEGSENVVAG